MSDSKSILASLAVHGAVILAAWQAPQFFQWKEKPEEPRVYTMEIIPAKENKVVTLKKYPKAKPKKMAKKPAKKKSLYTQKQKSPVKVVQSKEQEGSSAQGVQDGRNMVQMPGNLPPKYPVIDRVRKTTGKVTVMGYVGNDGKVSKVKITESSGTSRMNDSARQAFSSYKFQKGQEGWVKMPYEFTLGGDARVISVRDRETLDLIRSL